MWTKEEDVPTNWPKENEVSNEWVEEQEAIDMPREVYITDVDGNPINVSNGNIEMQLSGSNVAYDEVNDWIKVNLMTKIAGEDQVNDWLGINEKGPKTPKKYSLAELFSTTTVDPSTKASGIQVDVSGYSKISVYGKCTGGSYDVEFTMKADTVETIISKRTGLASAQTFALTNLGPSDVNGTCYAPGATGETLRVFINNNDASNTLTINDLAVVCLP